MASYPTLRKMRIIEEELGADWKKQHAGKSVDAIYNMVTGDVRKNLFCKISPEIKDKLDEMVEYHDVKMSSLVEKLVQEEYDKYTQERDARVAHIASQFAMST
jgi:hypothetical protein